MINHVSVTGDGRPGLEHTVYHKKAGKGRRGKKHQFHDSSAANLLSGINIIIYI